MAHPQAGPDGFPDDSRADVFVREFPTAVAPANRANLATKPPLFILRVPGDGAACAEGTHRVVEALRRSLDEHGKLVPYVYLAAAQDDSLLLAESAGLGLQDVPPEHMTPDRFPHFTLLRDLVTYIREHPDRWPGARAVALREYACDQQQAEKRGLLGALPKTSPPSSDLKGWFLVVFWLWFTRYAPRWLWQKRMSRKVMRRWLADEPVAAGGRNLFRVMDHVANVQSTRLARPAGDPRHEEALQELDQLLTRALLEDLRTPRVGGLLPRRRRRTARPVLLVELPPPGTDGARAAERFVRSLHRARATAQQPGPLVVIVGQPSTGLLNDLDNPGESNFSQAGLLLSQRDGSPVLVTFTDNAPHGPGLPVPQVEPDFFKTDWRTTTSFLAGALALALVGTVIGVRTWIAPPADHTCVGGTESVAEAARSTAIPVDAKGWYDAASQAIEEQNRRAEAYARQDHTVRTVVVFVSKKPTTVDETRFDGTIPELRGIAMWQKKLNDDAASNNSLVPLRVDVRATGEGFRNAEREAERLVAEVKNEQDAEDYKRVVGVLGYAQSREETQAALRVLGRAQIPTVGTTATADEMMTGDAGRSYWPFTPNNSREAGIEADFASQENIVARRGFDDECSPAGHAVVIESSADLYSRSLADRFMADFPGTERVFNFNQDNDFEPEPSVPAENLVSADVLARRICQALSQEPDSVLYWSARAKDFTAFVNSMDREGTCTTHSLTVLGGNELTNVAQTGVFKDKHWLRLYYSAHRLPSTDREASGKTRQFFDDYESFVESSTEGTDPWEQDGHSAVSYDAFHVLSQAVADARLADEEVDRRSVLLTLSNGVSFNGATGFVSYAKGVHAPPVDKTLVLLRQLADAPEAVVVCGAYGQGESSQKQDPPCRGGGGS
ncbi:ABC transporter substrate-binding protein [Streptomyces sporangiiformans]|uniref:ABC transporter substrate-binding protein n=1 Tax=Streptomyces sporangiiformans TaxID=2315329 RepID=A0A505CYB0_9ACTN|nr:ABC transporter substrate-binding protein [Streptomyces sporangiiformans]TPQ16564.1 ABC transporter substrate-binding protein [Streptomyces sporangiiformans]